MAQIKACPFCGKEAFAVGKRVSYGSTTRQIPEGTVLVDKRTYYDEWKKRDVTRSKWEKYGYTVKCATKNCFGHAGLSAYDSEDDAVTAWNNRKGA